MKNLFLVLAAAALCGCASFNSGDVKVRRDTAAAMFADKAITPFGQLQVSWRGFPYRAPTDSIGEGSASKPKVVKPVQADPGDTAALAEQAAEIFKEAGLYDPARGRGTLRLELTTFGRWNYGDLFRSFLVDTGFIFIIPASLRVNYFLTADFAAASGPVRVETEARNKTTFHLLLAPLYPFIPPGRKESSLLRQMLWRSATDVYTSLKEKGGVPAELPAGAKDKEKPLPLSGPPVPPDRTWLPGQEPGADAETPAIKPETPDKTWVVPDAEKRLAAPPEDPIKPAEADRSWETRTAPQETPDD
ncbi:MAG: hypothetical protein NDI60_11085 [Elusimicrobiales bacterium]|nr:hypothetical protein [Elusimicrobiales bacterium]